MIDGNPHFFYFFRLGLGRVKILTLISLALILASYSTYSVYMTIQAQSLVLGDSARYDYDSSADGGYVTKVKLILLGDSVTGAEISFTITRAGYYDVEISFSNGVESTSSNDCRYISRAGSYTWELSLRETSYYPKPSVEASVEMVPACL